MIPPVAVAPSSVVALNKAFACQATLQRVFLLDAIESPQTRKLRQHEGNPSCAAWRRSTETMNRRSALLLIAHIVACAVTLWYFAPRPDEQVRLVEGLAQPFKICGRSCDEGIIIQKVHLACTVDWFGARYACPQTFKPGEPARATYFVMPTLLSKIGFSEPVNVILTLDQSNQMLIVKTAEDHVRTHYLWPLHIYFLFAASFIGLNKSLNARK